MDLTYTPMSVTLLEILKLLKTTLRDLENQLFWAKSKVWHAEVCPTKEKKVSKSNHKFATGITNSLSSLTRLKYWTAVAFHSQYPFQVQNKWSDKNMKTSFKLPILRLIVAQHSMEE